MHSHNMFVCTIFWFCLGVSELGLGLGSGAAVRGEKMCRLVRPMRRARLLSEVADRIPEGEERTLRVKLLTLQNSFQQPQPIYRHEFLQEFAPVGEQ